MGEMMSYIMENLRMIRLRDIIDVAIVSYALYKCLKFVKETRAAQLIKGVVILLIFTQVSDWFELNVISFILSNTMQFAAIALIVVFQPELRRVLEKMGTSTFRKVFSNIYEDENIHPEICEAVDYMASQKIGALILMERKTKLGDIMSSGTDMNAKVSSELLINIFTPNTPLHDGAVVIGDNLIKSASCFLPLTQNNTLSKEMGTRHRAAVGVSEITDCISIVVSEETGIISVACNGEITRNLSAKQLEKYLDKQIQKDKDSQENAGAKKLFKNWMVNKK